MVIKKSRILILLISLGFVLGCGLTGLSGSSTEQSPNPISGTALIQSTATSELIQTAPPTNTSPVAPPASQTPTPFPALTSTASPTSTETEVVFEVGREITIDYLRSLEIDGSDITFEEQLANGPNYYQYVASYQSESNKIYGLLTIPFGEPPSGGFKAIVFNHGYIPPTLYRTTERYVAYVNYLARSGFVVFKIDYRGHGQSQGEPSGSYFSPGYTIDSIAAFKSLQRLDIIDPQGIGMWGHSMAGNLVLRAMEMEPDIKAGVIWAGAVYSYDDFARYGITDTSYRPPPTPQDQSDGSNRQSRGQEIFATYGRPDTQVAFWKAVSLTENIAYLHSPIQIHHAENDPVVNIGYSYDLATVLQENGKEYEFYSYEGGGHNLVSPYFDQAMLRTVDFFKKNL